MKAQRKARLSQTSDPQFNEQTNALLDRALELGAVPPSTHALLDLTRRHDAELGAVVDALALNPNLAAAVLRVANSPSYGQTRSVADLHRAVTIIGLQELHDLVAGTAMMAAFNRPHPLAQRLQATSVLSASVAQKLTVKLRAGSASTAYLSGLMCELGALACVALDPDYTALYEASEAEPRRRFEAEAVRYGGTTPRIGARILTMSMLPAVVSEAVGTAGFEPLADKSRLGCVVAFARLSAAILVRAAEHGDPVVLQDELATAAQAVDLPDLAPEKLTRICLAAATNAELTLRGELGLKQSAPMNDVNPTTSQNALAARSKRYDAYLVYALVTATAAAAATAWLLLR